MIPGGRPSLQQHPFDDLQRPTFQLAQLDRIVRPQPDAREVEVIENLGADIVAACVHRQSDCRRSDRVL